MEKEKIVRSHQEQERPKSAASAGEKPWQKPKFVFVEPKLIKHGELEQVTFGFSFTFTPDP
jgi:hypothetical protein